MTKNKKQSNRIYLTELQDLPNKNWAVFARKEKGTSAYFRCLIGSKEEAIEGVSRKFAAEEVSRGILDFTFYVVNVHHMVGIENMKPVDITIC